MKKIIYLFLLIFFLIFPAQCQAYENKVKVAGDKYFPPYEFLDEKGLYNGFDKDIMDAIALYEEFEIEYFPMNWDDALKALEDGKVDAVLGMSRSKEREKKFDFSEPILINSRVIFVKKDNNSISSFKDLNGKKISIQSGDIVEEDIKALKDTHIIKEKTQEMALFNLIDGKADAFVGNKYSGLYILQKNNFNNIVKIAGELVSSNEYCIAVNKNNKKLLQMINDGLSKIKKDKLYNKIYYKWFEQVYVDTPLITKKYLYIAAYLVLALIAIIITISFLNLRLKKTVEEKTMQIRKDMEEINSLYEELYAQDEELREQFNELKQLEEKQRELNERLMCLFINSPDAVVQFDENHIILAVNPAFERLFGYKAEECIGKDLDDIVTVRHEKMAAKDITKELFSTGVINTEGVRYTKDGKPIYTTIKAMLMKTGNKITGGYGIYTDITQVNEYKKKLEYMSYHDNLTGLYNRAYFDEKIKSISKSDSYPISIIMIDLNGLKMINDSMGHNEGDKLLINLAEILKESITSSDIAARIGGDEFALLLFNTDYAEAEAAANRIRDNIFKYNNNNSSKDFYINISLGFATASDKNIDIKQILKQADEMMYHNKLLNSSSDKSQILKVLLSTLAEKDYVTEGHTIRVKDLCQKLGTKLNLSEKELSDLLLLAEMHDLGKVAISDSILKKKGRLNEKEWEEMKQHCEKGYRIALSSPDLTSIAELILKHHERWDGKGYPLGLKGEEIPLLCRILSIVDAYDAMTSERGYNKVKSKMEALDEINNCAGTQFDPDVVKVFINLM